MRIKIKNNATTAEINGEKDWNEKIKSLDKYYKKCNNGVANCMYCTSNNFCYRCLSGFFLIEYDYYLYDHSKCYRKSDLSNQYYYYNKNNTHRPLCSSKFPGCVTCNTIGSKCTRCLTGYKLSKGQCYASSGQTTKKLAHCLQQQGNTCIKCESGYTPLKKERYGKCFPIPTDNEYYFDDNQNAYIQCLSSPYLERCLKCKDAYTCIECDTKCHVLQNGKCIRISN